MSFQQILGGQKPRFIFGGNTDLSYEDLQNMRKASNQHAARTQAGGFQGLANGIVAGVLRNRVRGGEKKGRDDFNSAFHGLIAGRAAGMPAGTPFIPQSGSQAPAHPVGQPAAAPSGDMASRIRQGLTARGLPEHVADAFILNFQDESGLNPGINEQNPIVPGSRGGFGLAQWTGPRRRQLEAFAGQRGTSVSDVDTQLDFLVSELQGSEAGAAKAIFAAQDTGTAADAIVRRFLRPAEEHRERRSARYLGGAQPSFSGAPTGGTGLDPNLVQLLDSPYASPGQKAVMQLMLQRQMAASAPPDPMQALQMHQAQLGIERFQLELDRLRNPTVDPMQQIELERAQIELEQLRNPDRAIIEGADGFKYYQDTGERVLPGVTQEQEPADEYQRYVAEEQAAGRQPLSRIDYAQAKRGKGTVVFDPTTGRPLVSIGGNEDPTDLTNPSTPGAMIASIDGILDDPALDMATGWMAWTQNIPGTASRRFGARASQLEGQAFLQAFESLKGGGQITEIEGRKATQAIGRLDTAQSAEDYRAALTELRDTLQLGMSRPQGWAANQPTPTTDTQLPPIPQTFLNGVGDPDEAKRVWEALTPEERALFQ